VALLVVEGVAISVERRRLLTGVSLSLRAGELVGIVGPSGSGKTELLRSIAGLRDAEEGAFRLEGRERGDVPWPSWRRQVTYVAQRPVMLEGSVRDNVLRPLTYASVQGKVGDDELTDLLGRMGLEPELLHQRARTLSVGEQQRVALLRALVIHPAVLLLDEPTSALDVEAVERVEALIRRRAESASLAALIVSHDPAQVARWTSRQLDIREHQVGATELAPSSDSEPETQESTDA
jgi:putative ABC transport system ATP-binding protein